MRSQAPIGSDHSLTTLLSGVGRRGVSPPDVVHLAAVKIHRHRSHANRARLHLTAARSVSSRDTTSWVWCIAVSNDFCLVKK